MRKKKEEVKEEVVEIEEANDKCPTCGRELPVGYTEKSGKKYCSPGCSNL